MEDVDWASAEGTAAGSSHVSAKVLAQVTMAARAEVTVLARPSSKSGLSPRMGCRSAVVARAHVAIAQVKGNPDSVP
jgi:hypothetical protein